MPALRRGVMVSVLLHAVVLVTGALVFDGAEPAPEIVDIEVAPPPPEAEALPAEVARKLDEAMAATQALLDKAAAEQQATVPDGEAFAIDAGVPDAPPDTPPEAPPDAAIDAAKPDAKPDAPPDAAEPMLAGLDGGGDADPVAVVIDAGVGDPAADAVALAAIDDAAGLTDAGTGDGLAIAELADAAGTGDATEIAMTGSGSGSELAGSGSGLGSDSRSSQPGPAIAAGSGSGSASTTDQPAVDGAPTSAGTAANLLNYFPPGHIVTAMIRFDRLRGTEWAAQTERLLRPMPDYRVLFGPTDAKIADRLDTLVISSPSPRDPRETTLVAHTRLGRAALRDFLGATTPVSWSAAKGGLLGKRTGKTFPGDKRVFLSPFRGWFMLAKPVDLGTLTTPVPGDLDAIEAKGKLPAWIGGIRSIEAESGEPYGPALIVTIATGGERIDLKGNDFGLGIQTVPTPDRLTLAMELVKQGKHQGWYVKGNLRFGSQKDAAEFVTVAESAKQRVEDSRALQMVMGKPLARVIKNLSFKRTGGAVSYATSISIADARAILDATGQQLDSYYGAPP